jgi:hypothetical protein
LEADLSPFEFFFSLFGLVLGLAIAVVIGGLSDVLRERERIKIGWLTPMLAIFLLFDLSTMWVNAWVGFKEIPVAHGPFAAGLVVAGVYFFAASMVFPKTAPDWPSLDDYYMGHHRFVLGGVLAANLGVAIIDGVANRDWAHFFLQTFAQSEMTALWWITLVVLCIVPRRRIQLIGLAVMLLIAAYTIARFWTPSPL